MDTDVHRDEIKLYLRFTLGQFNKMRRENDKISVAKL